MDNSAPHTKNGNVTSGSDPKISDPKIIVALDFDNSNKALALAKKLDPSRCRVKVGKELFTAAGPDVVRALCDLQFDVFLDLKFHDIPNTCAKAVKTAADLGVWMVNVHASGGVRMMSAAKEALEQSNNLKKPLLIGVTVLTSMEDQDLHQIGVNKTPAEQVLALADLVNQSGLDGVVCSAEESTMLRGRFGEQFCLVTPGIRPADSSSDDQRRIVTPKQALAQGSSYLVIGRPITQAEDPALACQKIFESIC